MNKQFVQLAGFYEGKYYPDETPDTVLIPEEDILMGKVENNLINLLIGTSKFTLTSGCTSRFKASVKDFT